MNLKSESSVVNDSKCSHFSTPFEMKELFSTGYDANAADGTFEKHRQRQHALRPLHNTFTKSMQFDTKSFNVAICAFGSTDHGSKNLLFRMLCVSKSWNRMPSFTAGPLVNVRKVS